MQYHLLFTTLEVIAEKPKYEIGSATKLSVGKKDIVNEKIAKVWKLSDDDSEIINENDLLDDQDKCKPNSSELKGKC